MMTYSIKCARGLTYDRGRAGARQVIWGKAGHWSREYGIRLYIYINGALAGSVHARAEG